METLGFFEKTISWTFYILIGFLIFAIFFRAKAIFFHSSERFPIKSIPKSKWIKALKTVYATCWLLFLFGLPISLFITSTFRRIIPEHITLLLWGAFTSLGILELVGCWTASKSLLERKLKQVTLVFIVLVLGYNAIKQLRVGMQVFPYPSTALSIILHLPVEGTWTAGHAGASVLTNYHAAVVAQQYAIDIVKQNEQGRFFVNEGADFEDHEAFGAIIKAPAAGRVVTVVDSLPNTPIAFTPTKMEQPAGNHVVIEIDTARYLFLAHLDAGSIHVRQGELVSPGDLIGKVGNSGNSSWPHLHLHIQDLPYIDNENATGYPFRFQQMERKRWFRWQEISNGFLLRNDVFRSVSD